MEMKEIDAQVFVDEQHGPCVRVKCGDSILSVWLMSETATVTHPDGQYGLEVAGPWHQIREAYLTVSAYPECGELIPEGWLHGCA